MILHVMNNISFVSGNDGFGIHVLGRDTFMQSNEIYNNNSHGVYLLQERGLERRGSDRDALSVVSWLSDFDYASDTESTTAVVPPSNADLAQVDHTQLRFNTIFHNKGSWSNPEANNSFTGVNCLCCRCGRAVLVFRPRDVAWQRSARQQGRGRAG